MADVHERFAKAFAQVVAVRKAQKNAFHGYQYRGIDDLRNALHSILADCGLFYVPRLVRSNYADVETSKGKPQQLATLDYEFEFYAPDGTSLVVGPVVGQAADTDDKAPMQAHSQAEKVALISAFCIPTDEQDPDASSPMSEEGGRGTADWHTSLRELLSKVPWPDEFDDDDEDVHQAAALSKMTKGAATTVSGLSDEQAQFIAGKLKSSKARQRFVDYAIEAAQGNDQSSGGDGPGSQGSGEGPSPSDTPPPASDGERLWADVQGLWRKLAIQGPRVLTHARMIVDQDELDGSEGRTAWDDPRDIGADAHPQVLRGLKSWLEDHQAKAGAA